MKLIKEDNMGNTLAVSIIANIILLVGISIIMWCTNGKLELFVLWVGVLGVVIGTSMLGGG